MENQFNQMGHKYLLTQRPPSIGTHPTDGLLDQRPITFRGRECYVLVYNRQLSKEEVRSYELTVDMESADLMFRSVSHTFAGVEIKETITNVGDNLITTTDEAGAERDYSWLEFQQDYPELFFNS